MGYQNVRIMRITYKLYHSDLRLLHSFNYYRLVLCLNTDPNGMASHNRDEDQNPGFLATHIWRVVSHIQTNTIRS